MNGIQPKSSPVGIQTKLLNALRRGEPRVGFSGELALKAEWFGIDIKANSKITYFAPFTLEITDYAFSAGLNVGFAAKVLYGGFLEAEFKGQHAHVRRFDMSTRKWVSEGIEDRIILGLGTGAGAGYLLEASGCAHASVSLDPFQPERCNVDFATGVLVGLELPDAKAIIALSPKLALRGEGHSILRLSMPTDDLMSGLGFKGTS